VKHIEVRIDAALTRQTADITRAYFDKSEVERGETASLKIVLKPFGQPEVIKTIPIEVPAATDALRYLVVTVVSGIVLPRMLLRRTVLTIFSI